MLIRPWGSLTQHTGHANLFIAQSKFPNHDFPVLYFSVSLLENRYRLSVPFPKCWGLDVFSEFGVFQSLKKYLLEFSETLKSNVLDFAAVYIFRCSSCDISLCGLRK